MTKLKKIWVGLLTKNISDAGSKTGFVLIVNDGGNVDSLHASFGKKSVQSNHLSRGEAGIYSRDLKSSGFNSGTGIIDPKKLSDSSVRIGIRGDDEWRPQHGLIWGQDENETIIPIAMEEDISVKLSTDSQEGKISLPLRRVRPGKKDTRIRRLLLMVETQQQSFPGAENPDPIRFETGTNDPIKLVVKNKSGTILVNHEISDTPQSDLEPGNDNFYIIPVISSFAKKDLNANSIVLSILGNDSWLPGKMFLFGLDTASGRPSNIIPLVHIDSWKDGRMSKDTEDGAGSITSKPSVTLKLLSDKESFGFTKDTIAQPPPFGGGGLIGG
jgi:hypothetical protein